MAPKNIGIFAVGALIVAGGVLYFASQMGKEEKVSWDERNSEAVALKEEQKKLSEEIKTLAGDNLCRTDADCDVLGLGAELCGGHKKFLIFSMYGSGDNKPNLRKKVKRFNEVSSRLHDLSLKAESCGVSPHPVRCIKKRCVQVVVEKN